MHKGMNNCELAVIIPAFKPDFLPAALESLSKQTDNRFRLYIGDDASSADLRGISEQFAGRMDIVYHRFPENSGAISLITHWHRCIRLSAEPWVWLFADDDVADPTCVAEFYRVLQSQQSIGDLYRFELAFIDANGAFLRSPPALPAACGPHEFLYHRILHGAGSAAPEHIFSRRIFEAMGGMVDFPSATCSDDATWMLFSRETPMLCIPGGKVYWRQSDVHVSGRASSRQTNAVARIEFLAWLLRETAPGGRLVPRNMWEKWLWAEAKRGLPQWFNSSIDYLRIPSLPNYKRCEWEVKIMGALGSLGAEIMKSFPLCEKERKEARRREYFAQGRLLGCAYQISQWMGVVRGR